MFSLPGESRDDCRCGGRHFLHPKPSLGNSQSGGGFKEFFVHPALKNDQKPLDLAATLLLKAGGPQDRVEGARSGDIGGSGCLAGTQVLQRQECALRK